MKKRFFILATATIAMAYVATATAKTSWPVESWSGDDITNMSRYPLPARPVALVGSWPAC